MEVYLNSITGIDDAIVSMFISKRTLTKKLENKIRLNCMQYFDRFGNKKPNISPTVEREVEEWLEKLFKWGKKHITMLKFIDLSFNVYGMHRAGQDDWDSHAKRFDNRIVRSSTRLASYGEEMSDWYKDKIITTDQALNILESKLPERIINENGTFVRAVNGYVREDLVNKQDVRRGLYMLSIPSNFIFRINLAEFAHVYKHRGEHGNANPEVKECAEECLRLLHETIPMIDKELLLGVDN